MLFDENIRTKQLKDVLSYIDCRVIIWQEDVNEDGDDGAEKIFEGWVSDIPWKIMNYWLTSNDGEEPIDLRMVPNNNNVTLPTLVITVCEDKERVK